MKAQLLREITPLTKNDCFTFFSITKTKFDLPLHYHEEFELNFIQHAKGAKRIIGDHSEEITDLELVLIGPNLPHGWFNHKLKGDVTIKEFTIQFQRDLFDESFLNRHQMQLIKSMFELSLRGILFSRETTESIMPRLKGLTQKHGFDSVLELLSLLHELSRSRNIRTLCDTAFTQETLSYGSHRVGQIMIYINQNFEKHISLAEAAKLAGMTEAALSRFFKMKTGKTFVDTLNEVRLANASRLLIDTTLSISEVAYKCGFSNISNFNRIFKKKKTSTPKDFRETYNSTGIRTFV